MFDDPQAQRRRRLANTLQAARHARHLTYQQLATKAGLGYKETWVCCNTAASRTATLLKLLDVLELDIYHAVETPGR